MAGWVKLHRCLINKPIFDNANLLKVWVWCLCKATHKNHTQIVGLKKIELKTGQFITGRSAGSTELKLKPSTFWDYIQFLKDNQSINIESNSKYSVITIENWDLYQVDEEQTDNKTDNKPTANRQRTDTNKNVKNDKKNSYSEFVKLTTVEYERLINEFGQAAVERMIDILNNYKGSKGKKYASDNLAIRSWVIKRYQDEQSQTKLFTDKPKSVMDKAEEAKRRYELRHGIATSDSNERSISIV